MGVIELVDVSPRDGLQNEARIFSTEEKLELINQSISAGVRRIEVASFVHPKLVPQMADAEAVCKGLPNNDDVTYIGLVLNGRGVDRAMETQVDELGFVAVASDGFGQKNQGMTSAESVTIVSELVRRTIAEGRAANITISTAFGCPFDRDVAQDHVVDMCKAFADCGTREIALADTIGVGTPWQAESLFAAVADAVPGMPLRAHFHNTRNTAIANAYAAIGAGAITLDGSIGGIGGCPFAPNATGNVALEDLLYMLQTAGFETGIDLQKINQTATWLTKKMDRVLPGMVSRVG